MDITADTEIGIEINTIKALSVTGNTIVEMDGASIQINDGADYYCVTGNVGRNTADIANTAAGANAVVANNVDD